MFLGWYDPDKKKPARDKVREAMDRYREKFGIAAVVCQTGRDAAAELLTDPAAPDIDYIPREFIPRNTFYVGREEDEEGGE